MCLMGFCLICQFISHIIGSFFRHPQVPQKLRSFHLRREAEGNCLSLRPEGLYLQELTLEISGGPLGKSECEVMASTYEQFPTAFFAM